MSVNRSGINEEIDTGVLHRATFEETSKTLKNAAIYNEEDNLNGIIAAIITG